MEFSEIVALHTFSKSSQIAHARSPPSCLSKSVRLRGNDRFATGQTGLRLGRECYVYCSGISRFSRRSKGRNGLTVEAGDEEK